MMTIDERRTALIKVFHLIDSQCSPLALQDDRCGIYSVLYHVESLDKINFVELL